MQIFGSRFGFNPLIPNKKRWWREIQTWMDEPPVQMEALSE
jgi:hypothetical protein